MCAMEWAGEVLRASDSPMNFVVFAPRISLEGPTPGFPGVTASSDKGSSRNQPSLGLERREMAQMKAMGCWDVF